MATSGKFIALSQFDIENKILDYFVNRFHRPPTEITRNTDLKVHFNFDTKAKWASLAPALSAEDWMKSLNVAIAQSEMDGHFTAKALANLIWAKVTKLVAVQSPAASLNTPTFSLPKPTATAKKPGAARKAKKSGKKQPGK